MFQRLSNVCQFVNVRQRFFIKKGAAVIVQNTQTIWIFTSPGIINHLRIY